MPRRAAAIAIDLLGRLTVVIFGALFLVAIVIYGVVKASDEREDDEP